MGMDPVACAGLRGVHQLRYQDVQLFFMLAKVAAEHERLQRTGASYDNVGFVAV